ncbi:DUF3237 family protein [Anaerosporobacter sp.]|uniref:DUF3237 family protein n=1 Tax=Anaerosporobacter sp. TaxID=1872529 RepID=UPI00286EE8B8|nr:DUF3237 family protein [Anaerosporobacter sp.]
MKTFVIKIRINECFETTNGSQTAKIILFSGECDNEYFKGHVLDGGVDTQIQSIGKRTTLSARYILEGLDYRGNTCKIFIENNGYIEEDGSIHTRPFIITDSSELKWLETQMKSGYIEHKDNSIYVVLTDSIC